MMKAFTAIINLLLFANVIILHF